MACTRNCSDAENKFNSVYDIRWLLPFTATVGHFLQDVPINSLTPYGDREMGLH